MNNNSWPFTYSTTDNNILSLFFIVSWLPFSISWIVFKIIDISAISALSMFVSLPFLCAMNSVSLMSFSFQSADTLELDSYTEKKSKASYI